MKELDGGRLRLFQHIESSVAKAGYDFKIVDQRVSQQAEFIDIERMAIPKEAGSLNPLYLLTDAQAQEYLDQRTSFRGWSLTFYLSRVTGSEPKMRTGWLSYCCRPTWRPWSRRTVFLKYPCLLYTSPSPRDQRGSRMPSSA